MKKDISKNIIDRIKQEQILPDSKLRANFKSYLFWALLFFIVLVSAAFFSLAILSFVDFDLELLRQMRLRKYVMLLMVSAPYLWIVMLVLTIFLGYHFFRKTKRGYRYSVLFVAGIIFLVVSALGVSAHVVHVNTKFNDVFVKGPAPLRQLAPPGEQKFFGPDEGVIAGKIIEKNNSFFVIETLENGQWEISYDESTRVKDPGLVGLDNIVIVVGEKTEEQKFNAFGIKPMKGPKGERRKINQGNGMRRPSFLGSPPRPGMKE